MNVVEEKKEPGEVVQYAVNATKYRQTVGPGAIRKVVEPGERVDARLVTITKGSVKRLLPGFEPCGETTFPAYEPAEIVSGIPVVKGALVCAEPQVEYMKSPVEQPAVVTEQPVVIAEQPTGDGGPMVAAALPDVPPVTIPPVVVQMMPANEPGPLAVCEIPPADKIKKMGAAQVRALAKRLGIPTASLKRMSLIDIIESRRPVE